MIKKKFKNKKGGSTIFEIVICITIITFILFYPIATFSLTHKKNLLQDTLTISLQMASIQGGVTSSVENVVKLNAETKGLDANKIIIKSNNTSNNKLIYREDSTPINIEILYPAEKEVSFINGLNKMIGAKKTLPFEETENGKKYYYKLQGFILSEKINY